MAGAASQAGDAESSRTPGLTSGLQGSVNVHRCALLLVSQWQCISSSVFYIIRFWLLQSVKCYNVNFENMTYNRRLYVSECPVGTYGQDCLKNCTCNSTNSRSCDNIRGFCSCRDEWKGLDCDIPASPCSYYSNLCGDTGKCVDTQEYYTCICNPGYIKRPQSNNCSGVYIIRVPIY